MKEKIDEFATALIMENGNYVVDNTIKAKKFTPIWLNGQPVAGLHFSGGRAFCSAISPFRITISNDLRNASEHSNFIYLEKESE